MKKSKKLLLLIFTAIISLFLLSGCSAKNNEYVKVCVYLTEEGSELYATGLSRSTILATSKGEVAKPADWKELEGEYTYPEGYSFSSGYNEVKSYILFTRDPQEIINKLTQKKQPLDIAFLPISEFNNVTISDAQKEKLAIVYVDTYTSDGSDVSGVWIARKGYMTYKDGVNSYFKKVIASLVKANEFAYTSISKNSTFTLENGRASVDAKASELSDFEKKVYDFLGKSYSEGRTVDVKDFEDLKVKEYIAVLESSLKSSDIGTKNIEDGSAYSRKSIYDISNVDTYITGIIDLVDDHTDIQCDFTVWKNQILVYKNAKLVVFGD